MSPRTTLSLATALAAVAALGAGPAAAADLPVAADPTAQNVTTYGSTNAWSRKAADGYHLVIARGSAVVDAPVPVSSEPYDPDLGPAMTFGAGRTIVYARDGDLYRYDIGNPAEEKLSALSSPQTETAPSFFGNVIVFSRTTGPKKGVYISRPGVGIKRLFRTVAAETDVSQTRVIGRFGQGSKSIIRILNYNADNVRIVTRAKVGERLASPTLTRFNGIWLRVRPTASRVEQVGVNSHRGLVIRTADRPLPGQVTSLSSFRIPTLYTTAGGVQRIAPKLRFG